MEDFPILFLFLIFYLVTAFSGKKKSKKKKPMRSRAQGEKADVRAQRRDRQTHQGFGAAFAQEPAAQAMHAPCDAAQMHLHHVADAQLQHAQEGEDPCHVGGRQSQAQDEAGEAWQDEAQELLKQDVLRGVIMSEILTRPQERRAWQRSRREYHGY